MIMDRIALVLAIIGGLNWGSIGLFRFDLVAWLFGGQTATVSRVVYTLVGLETALLNYLDYLLLRLSTMARTIPAAQRMRPKTMITPPMV